MAIQKNLEKEELGGLVITGAYHRIHSINLVFESDPKPTGLDEQHSHVGEEASNVRSCKRQQSTYICYRQQ